MSKSSKYFLTHSFDLQATPSSAIIPIIESPRSTMPPSRPEGEVNETERTSPWVSI